MKYPHTKRKEFEEEIHGRTISDPYCWLESDESEEVSQWIGAQNAFTRENLTAHAPLSPLKERLEEVYHVDATYPPLPRGNAYFFLHRKAEEDFASLYVREGRDGTPRKLIDTNLLSDDHSVTLSRWLPSDDGSLLAYELSEAGNDQRYVLVMDVPTGEPPPDTIPADIYPRVEAWDSTGTGFWYVRRSPDAPASEAKFHKRIYYHTLGESYENDVYVFGNELNKEDIPFLGISDDARSLVVNVVVLSEEKRRNVIFIKHGTHAFQWVFEDVDAHAWGLVHRGRVYVRTKNESVPRGHIISHPLADAIPPSSEWEEVIPESEYILNDIAFFGENMCIEYEYAGAAALHHYSLTGTWVGEIPLPAHGSIHALQYQPEGNELFFFFSSYTIPHRVYRYDASEKRTDLYTQDTPLIDTDAFSVTRQWAPSTDGTQVPMFIACKKEARQNEARPALVYGYGGFNKSITPGYQKWLTPFLEAGGVYVAVGLRGGGEFGEKWHKAGARTNKQNVFDDLVSAIEYLITEGYTSPERVAIYGWSNGGLLTSAVTMQRPDLIRAALIGAPVADMLRFHLFHSGRNWITEFGDPDKNADAEYMLTYSPYHNVAEHPYPAALILTAEKDDRVHPGHAYKLAASLQENNTSHHPIFLRVERKAGHSGARAISKAVERFTDILGFVFWQLGMETGPFQEHHNSAKGALSSLRNNMPGSIYKDRAFIYPTKSL